MDPNSEIVDRILKELKPVAENARPARAFIVQRIEFARTRMRHLKTWRTVTSKNEREALKGIAGALGRATAKMKTLSPEGKKGLFVQSEIRSAGLNWPAGGGGFEDFLKIVDLVAQRARLHANFKPQAVGGPGEITPRGKPKKRYAANCANELIELFGNKPSTLTHVSNLASLFYEAFTGRKDANLDRQSRAILKPKK